MLVSRQKKIRGSISVDFLFSFTVTLLLVLYLLMVSLTLSLMEVAQYVSFATAREFYIGQINYSEHEERAREKYNELKLKFFKPVMSSWFSISEEDDLFLGDVREDPQVNNYEDPVPPGSDQPHTFVGARLFFTSKVLGLEVPFLGDPLDNPSSSFKAHISSYMGREPSQEECKSFQAERCEWISNFINPSSMNCSALNNKQPGDNGC